MTPFRWFLMVSLPSVEILSSCSMADNRVSEMYKYSLEFFVPWKLSIWCLRVAVLANMESISAILFFTSSSDRVCKLSPVAILSSSLFVLRVSASLELVTSAWLAVADISMATGGTESGADESSPEEGEDEEEVAVCCPSGLEEESGVGGNIGC